MRILFARNWHVCFPSIAGKININVIKWPLPLLVAPNSSKHPVPKRLSSVYSTAPSASLSVRQPTEMEVPGVPQSQILELLESFAPTSFAEKWDNVGLLIECEDGAEKLINKVLLTNDLTEDVLDEAVEGDFNMIISYHPPIFEAMKRVTSSTWKGRIVKTCLKKDITVYSPHTAWDAVQGGVNDWLIQAFDAFNPNATPILQSFEPNKQATHLAEAIVPKEKASRLISRIRDTLTLTKIGEIPYQMEDTNFVKITIPCKTKDIVPLTEVLQHFPHTFSKHEENPVLNYGMGRSCTLGKPQKLKDIIEEIKKHLHLPDISLALARGANMDTIITSVAVCAGSGGQVLQAQKVDLFLTGEMSHHQVLDAVHKGVTVILTRHSNSERGFLTHFLSVYLNKHLAGKVNFAVSTKDQDPLHTV